jgi:hypothetical protein
MSWDWSSVNEVTDDAVVAGGIALLVVRQFLWRSAEPRRMLRLPLGVIVVGFGYLGSELRAAGRWTSADWSILAELVLVSLTGVVMGRVTRFRATGDRLQYRLTGVGIWLWALFVAIRVGSYGLAHAMGSDLAGATGPLLISFGANRLLSVLVVRARTRALLGGAGVPTASARLTPAGPRPAQETEVGASSGRERRPARPRS